MDAIGNRASPEDVVRLARAWIGTPYVLGAALRGAGADCVGVVRGVFRDVTGAEPPAPPGWRADWSMGPGHPLILAARRHLVPRPVLLAAPGDVVGFRLGADRVAHCGILTGRGRMVHAKEGVGVVEVHMGAMAAQIAFAASFPAPPD